MSAPEKDKVGSVTVEVGVNEKADPDHSHSHDHDLVQDPTTSAAAAAAAHGLIDAVPDAEESSPTLVETIGYLLSIQDGYGPLSDSTWDMDDFD